MRAGTHTEVSPPTCDKQREWDALSRGQALITRNDERELPGRQLDPLAASRAGGATLDPEVEQLPEGLDAGAGVLAVRDLGSKTGLHLLGLAIAAVDLACELPLLARQRVRTGVDDDRQPLVRLRMVTTPLLLPESQSLTRF